MKKFVLCAMVLLGLSHAEAGTLQVEKPVEIKIKKQKLIIDPGTYEAKLTEPYKHGIFTSKQFLEYKIQTNAGVLEGKLQYEKKNRNLKDQVFGTKESDKSDSKVISDFITERRECVIKSWTSEENCRIVNDYECDVFGECHSKQSISCDTVHHEIKGEHDVTFKKVSVTYQRFLSLINKADQSVLAVYTTGPSTYETEGEVTQTKCR